MELHVLVLDLPGLTVAEAVRRLAHRERVTAWSGTWAAGGLVTCDPVPAPCGGFPRLPAVRGAGAWPGAVGGGWFGYRSADGGDGFPTGSWAWYRDVLRHAGDRWFHEALLDDGFTAADARRRAAALVADLRRPVRPVPARWEVTAWPDRSVHVAAVERCVQAIRRGEVFQANLAVQVAGRLHGSVHEAWAQLVERHDPARAGLVADPAGAAVGASPELFLRRSGRRVRTEPIKGTRPRGARPDLDRAERDRLAGSVKDAAENVMIVDLMRNDLSRVCDRVGVPRLLDVEAHPGVWHLVSTVEGELRPGVDDADLLAATFPPGSVTGAPKLRAVELISEWEAAPRGLFTGVLGHVGPLAGAEWAVAIRTLAVAADGTARLGVGGGVTVDSVPDEEWAECRTKAAPLLTALGADPWPTDPPPAARADPQRGLFETLLAVDGRPRRLGEHERRLRASFLTCYGRPLTADVAAAVAAALAGAGPGPVRVRLDASPDGALSATAGPAAPVPPADQPGLALVPHDLGPGGAPAHKYADRAWAEEIEAGLTPGRAALLLDDRGFALESTRAGIAAVIDGRVVLPPLDGRILPGTTRRALLDALDVLGPAYDIRPVHRAELAAAQEVFLHNAVRGVQWVRSVSGATWAGPGPVAGRLAEVLTGPGGVPVAL